MPDDRPHVTPQHDKYKDLFKEFPTLAGELLRDLCGQSEIPAS